MRRRRVLFARVLGARHSIRLPDNSGHGRRPVRVHAPLVASSPDQRYVFDAQFNSNGSRIVTASSDQTARIWDAPTGTEILKMKVAEEHAVRVACFSPDDRVVATGSDDGMLGIWDAQSGRRLVDPIRAVPDEQGGWNMIWTIQFSQDGKTILTAGTDGSARLWNAQSGEAIGQPMRHRARVASAGFSPDEKRVLTASDDWTARQWDASTGQQIGPELNHDDHVTSAFYSPDGDLILTASEDGSVRLWDTQSGSPVVAPMRHGATVRVARFDPLGERIVTACEDGTASIWDARLGLPLSEPIRHSVAVVDACFNSKGTRILTASDAVRLWLFPPPLEAAHLPSWLPDWAESVVALRLGPKHVPEFVPQDEFFAVRSQITTSVESDFPTQLANWFFLDRSKRSHFLGSPVLE